METERAVIEVRGARLHVEQRGGPGGGGGTVLWGHGLCSSSEQDGRAGLVRWDRVADAGHRVVRWDARGHGRSGGERDATPYRWDELARDLLALADALEIDRFVAGGVSMGAATALHAAVLAPERVEALVLALAPTAYESRPAQAASYREGADLVEREGIDAYVAAGADQPVPELLAPFADQYHAAPEVAEDRLPWVLRGAALSDLPPLEAVARLGQPTLLLAWESDPGHPVSTSESLATALPGAELQVARRLGDVARWTDRVLELLSRRPAG